MSSVANFPVRELGGVISARAGGTSIQGVSREPNEDCFSFDVDGRFFVITDGIGGSEGGEIASRIACEVLHDELSRLADERNSGEQSEFPFSVHQHEDLCNDLVDAMKAADSAIVSEKVVGIPCNVMGTTAIAAFVVEQQLYLASIGDSRAYLVRDGRAQQLTHDHTMAAGLVDAGILTPEQAATHQYRNVLYKFLGAGPGGEPADVESFNIQSGDCLVLSTDGVTDCVSEEEITAVCEQCAEPEHAAGELAGQAIKNGSRDDATCIIVFFD